MGNHHGRFSHSKHHHHNQQGPPFSLPTQQTHNTQMGLALPYAHVDSNLRGLAGQAEGFGASSIGGRDGHVYQVVNLNASSMLLLLAFLSFMFSVPHLPLSRGSIGNNLSTSQDRDDGPGSLRDGCRKKEPLWIVFEVSGTIELRSHLSVSSFKTIDGRGQKIKLTGKGLRLKECEHVIICNLEFEGGRGPDVDGIQIKPKSRHIWIDRCSLSDYDDGLIDITKESTDITVSRCHFSKHDKTMLIGGDSSNCGDRCMRVTIHHCFFDGTRQRHPRVRFAKVHLYNNYTRNWGIYAVCASVESQIYSQCNIYEAGQKKVAFKYLTEKAADMEEACTGSIKSEDDLFVCGTQAGLLSTCSENNVCSPSEFYQTWTVERPSDDLKHYLQHCTGWQCIPRPN